MSLQLQEAALHILLGLGQVFRLAEITPVIGISTKSHDFFSLCREAQIGSDNRKKPLLGYEGKEAWRNYMYAREREHLC